MRHMTQRSHIRPTDSRPTSCFDGAWPCLEHDEHVRLPAAVVEVIEQARLVSQWHDSMNSGPLEELDAELGSLRAAVLTLEAPDAR